MITAAEMRVLIAAGVKAEVIAAAVEAGEREILDRKREQGRDRQRRFRHARKRDSNATERDVTLSRVTSLHPHETIETIEDFKASLDADDKTASLTYLLTSTEDSLEGKKEGVGVTRARGRNANKRDRLHVLPEGWKPPERAYAVAVEAGTTVEAVLPVFLDYLSSSGKLYANHDAAFCNFVRNQSRFNGGKGNGNERRRTVQDAARDLHEAAVEGRLAQWRRGPPDRSLDTGTGEAVVRLLPKG